jgi:hypothetical protein
MIAVYGGSVGDGGVVVEWSVGEEEDWTDLTW